MDAAHPVFIHSLFRAGSTYFFNCFRRSSGGYWCYQEPLNEFLVNAVTRPEALLEDHKGKVAHLRHPELDQPYFYEFFPLADQIAVTFNPDFPYVNYFSNSSESSEALCRYLNVLVRGAQGRPVFQECRSAGRVQSIRECLGGLHIFLWRNPWDQWWSYKVDSHFELCNLQILAAKSAPPLFVELREMLGFRPNGADMNSLVAQRLDAAGSYMLFFALWSHAMLTASPCCELEVNIDRLSSDLRYRQEVTAQLEAASVSGIDFSDCATPIGVYGRVDREFFEKIESRTLALFKAYGYSDADLRRITRLRSDCDPRVDGNNKFSDKSAAGYDRLRHIARRLESELSLAQKGPGNFDPAYRSREILQEKIDAKDAELQALAAKLSHAETRLSSLEATLRAKEEAWRRLKAALRARDAELTQVKTSRYWRWGRPIRKAGSLVEKLIHGK